MSRLVLITFAYYFYIFSQSECRIVLIQHENENLVLQAVVDVQTKVNETSPTKIELLIKEKVKTRNHKHTWA